MLTSPPSRLQASPCIAELHRLKKLCQRFLLSQRRPAAQAPFLAFLARGQVHPFRFPLPSTSLQARCTFFACPRFLAEAWPGEQEEVQLFALEGWPVDLASTLATVPGEQEIAPGAFFRAPDASVARGGPWPSGTPVDPGTCLRTLAAAVGSCRRSEPLARNRTLSEAGHASPAAAAFAELASAASCAAAQPVGGRRDTPPADPGGVVVEELLGQVRAAFQVSLL
eukprot:888881-Rhodomonas_salina.2